MGLTAETFWSCTPRELDALGHIRNTRLEVEGERFATVAAALYNQAYRRKDEKLYTREDFGAKAPPKPAESWRTRYTQSEDDMKGVMGRMIGVGVKNGQ